MKKLFSLSFLGLILFFGSCSDDKNENILVNDDTTLSDISTNLMNFDYEGGSANFSVKCAAVPEISSDESWIIVNRLNSSNKVHTYSVTVSANPQSDIRMGYVTVTSGKSSEIITINQEAAPNWSVDEPTEDETQSILGINAVEISKQIKNGWNIGNTLEVPGGETGWGNPKVNEAYVAGIKAAGFNAVRIPCAWDSHIIDSKTNTIDPEWLDRVNEVVGYVLSNDMFAILNIHWDGGWLENNIGNASTPELVNKQKALWTQIATRLAHYNEKLLFAGLNEPNAGNEWGSSSDNVMAMQALLDYEQAFVDGVRSTGGNNATRTLVVQAPHTSINMAYDYMDTLPEDPAGEGYMMVEVHYYDPSDYTIMETDGSWSPYVKFFWGKDYHQGGNRDCSWGEESSMLSQLQKMENKFVNKGIPVVLGEYGAYPEEHISKVNVTFSDDEIATIKASREYWYQCFSKYTNQTGILPFVWDTGELINRNTGEVKDGKQYIIDAILSGHN